MVFSTLHTNTALGTITRLRDMGVEPFLLSSSLEGILAQRLVRILCEHCKQPYAPSEAEIQALGIEDPNSALSLYRPIGCEQCNYQGYRGRQGIYELIDVDYKLRSMIHEGASEQRMEKHIRKKHPSIFADGLRRILDGETSVEEVLRVTQEK